MNNSAIIRGNGDLFDLLRVLRRNKFLLLLCPVVAIIGAILLVVFLPAKYTSSVSILLDPKESGAHGPGGQFTSQSVDTFKVGSVVALLQSNELLDKVVAREHLADDLEFGLSKGLVSTLVGLLPGLQSAPPSQPERLAKATEALRNATRIGRDGFSYVIKVDVSARSPAKAQRLAQALAETYLSDQIEAKYATARRDARWLAQRLAELRSALATSEDKLDALRRTRGLIETDSEVREAQRVAAADKQLYETYLSRYKELEQRATTQEAEARIISAPRLPTEPSFPQPVSFLIGAIVLGLAAGIAAAVIRDRIDVTFATPADVERSLGLPVIASVPMAGPRELGIGVERRSILDYAGAPDTSQFLESLRSIRSGIFYDPTKRAKSVQFTSAMPDEGKSTLAACVAVSAASAGLRTIVLDCDFRHPKISRMFDCENSDGIAEILYGSTVLVDAMVQTRFDNLSIVPAGRCQHRPPPDFANPNRLKKLLVACGRIADLVIVDSAALEAVPDATMISQVVDEAVMIVKWRRSDRDLVRRSLDRLRRVDGHVCGIVLNAVDMNSMKTDGYYSKNYINLLDGYFSSARARGRTLS